MKKLFFLFATIAIISCKKQDQWLNKKSNKNDVTPSKLQDYQALLNNDGVMNASYPSLGLVGSDNYYVTTATWQSKSTTERNAYVWAADIFEGANSSDWRTSYQMIAYANLVLDGITRLKVQPSEQQVLNTVKGSALFYRAMGFYNLAALFTKPFSATTANSLPGIPLKLTPDVNDRINRGTVAETYNQIIKDLDEAESLLPETPAYKTQPSKPAVNALLSKVYLNMEDYVMAGQKSALVLNANNSLIDFNSLNTTSTYPLPTFQNDNKEVIFHAQLSTYSIMSGSGFITDSLLYRSYSANDLRHSVFYKDAGNGVINFRGSYTGNVYPFAGLGINEIYLIHAEVNARLGNTTAALNDINALLIKRWKTGTFLPLTATNADDALNKILLERRKELPFTANIRWEDLRRLNKDTRFAKAIYRIVNNQTYILPPNDNRYVYPIPENEIQFTGLEQNPR